MRISKHNNCDSDFIRRPIMRQHLLEALKDDKVTGPFSYLRALK